MTVTTRLRTAAVATVVAATGALALTTLPATAGSAFTTTTKTVTRTPMPLPHMTAIRTGRHATFDRVVLDLQGKAPGYKVGYVKVVREDGSGTVVAMRGRYHLMIRLTSAQAHTNSGTPTYTGSHKFFVGLPELRQVAFVGDFEGVVSVALGLAHRNGFRVFTLHDPTRIVVDIHH